MSNDFSFGIKKAFTPNTTPSEIVFFDTTDPNTGGTVFDPNTPAQADTLYVSSVDASTWIYSGGAYVSYTPPATASTPFYLFGTTIDAGANKTASIYRIGSISVTNALGTSYGNVQVTSNGFIASYNGITKNWLISASTTASNGNQDIRTRYRGTLASASVLNSGDYISERKEVAYTDTVYYERVEATENQIAGASTGVKKIFQTTKDGSATLEDRLEFTNDGYVKLNGAYKMPNVDGTSGQVMKTDGAGNVTWQSGGSSGIFGISDSSGTYTYYATLTLAMASAVSGDTIEQFADVTETGSVTITLTPGVKINGNGYTYTLNVDDATNALALSSAGTVELSNWKVIRTGRANGSTGRVFFSNQSSLPTLKCKNVTFTNTYGEGMLIKGSVFGLNLTSYNACLNNTFESVNLDSCNFTSTNSSGVSSSGGTIVNCNITASTFGISSTGHVYNSIATTTSGTAIGASRVVNSTGLSTSGTAISTSSGYNCVGISTSGVTLIGSFNNSTGISTSSVALNGGTFTNCIGISSSSNASTQATINGGYLQSTSNVTFLLNSARNIYNATVVCLWNNSGGHGISTSVLVSDPYISNCTIVVTNSSAYCLNAIVGSTYRYANNSFRGATIPVNTTNITQGITNTSDSQGNILM